MRKYDETKHDSRLLLELPSEMHEDLRKLSRYRNCSIRGLLIWWIEEQLVKYKYQIDGIDVFDNHTRFGIEEKARVQND